MYSACDSSKVTALIQKREFEKGAPRQFRLNKIEIRVNESRLQETLRLNKFGMVSRDDDRYFTLQSFSFQDTNKIADRTPMGTFEFFR